VSLLIDVEGIDGSGKGTQAALLRDRLRGAGLKSGLLSFPRYEATLFGRAVGEVLDGRFGSLDAVHPFFAALLFAGDRLESRELLQSTIEASDVVVLDRYVASNIAHQGAKREGDERAELIERIERIEHDIFGLPRPDLVLLLDLPAVEAQRLIATKNARAYTDRRADLQEADAGYLERVRDVYQELAVGDSRWRTIHCMQGDTVRAIDEIAEEIWEVVRGERGDARPRAGG
jgi:dTMP kinase